MLRVLLFLFLLIPFFLTAVHAEEKKELDRYEKVVLSHKPIAYWRLQGTELKNEISSELTGTVVGKVQQNVTGPRPSVFPDFSSKNTGIKINHGNSFIRVNDPGEKSPLDFDKGDHIAIEAWVNPEQFPSGERRVILAKGRTGNSGFDLHDLNYALRLESSKNNAKVNFLFRSAGEKQGWHSWTSKNSFSFEDGWHHVVLQFQYGKKRSPVCYIDGELSHGIWGFEGATEKAPVVQNNELWIGSSQKGLEKSTFKGALDEIALYRRLLTKAEVQSHFKIRSLPLPIVDKNSISKERLFVEVFESIPDSESWIFRSHEKTDEFTMPAFGIVDIPNKYSERGIKVDRSNPFLLRATGRVIFPEGTQRLLVRSRNSARLLVDGKQVLETPFHNIGNSGHGTVFDINTDLAPNIRPLHRGDQEKWIEIEGDGKEHLVQFLMIVGGDNRRADFGESAVFIGTPGKDFTLLSSNGNVLLTDESWTAYTWARREEIQRQNSHLRRQIDSDERAYWNQRHLLAKERILKQNAPKIPDVPKAMPVRNDIDRFIGHKLKQAKQKPAHLTNDSEFLRRVTLDIIGLLPTEKQIQRFAHDKKEGRRKRAIEKLMNDSRWADNWVGYWQDVLAENPNIIKPTLNNTGPFRFWIYESFLDNKPFDRFATELIRMEGSTYYGGAAGFKLAAQNDVPMAAKAYILGQAFLGVNMKCARCHDAPFHDIKQEDLFSLAAMLERKPIQVPASSSIPADEEELKSMIVEVTLKPGASVPPAWRFSEIAKVQFDEGVIRDLKDSREQAAALITSARNDRFAKVIVNRLWKHYLGYGLVDKVDDWEDAEPSHPELLDFLARELILNNYDLKHVARLIFNSHTYQRVAVGIETVSTSEAYLFAAPIKRRMRAEQIVDSLFLISNQPFDAGPISLDIDSSMTKSTGFHLGVPTKSWQFASLSNERDRPSLSLPFAEPFVSTLEAFGWRGTRQEPQTDREETTTAIQPALFANGILTRRIVRLTNQNGLTELALKEKSVSNLVDRLVAKILSRSPTKIEKQMFVALLSDGFENRIVDNPKPVVRKRLPRNLVSWTNHLNTKANEIKVALQKEVQNGEPPTEKLNSDWRQRCEDMIWSLINTPEFIFIP